jgi:peptidyl-prolyl cis-trans isomerase A (cyclophilin A)
VSKQRKETGLLTTKEYVLTHNAAQRTTHKTQPQTMRVMRATFASFLFLLNAVQCCVVAVGFVLPISTNTVDERPGAALASRSLLRSSSSDISCETDTSSSRRSVLNRSLSSLLAIGSCLPSYKAYAEEEESSITDDQPFTVVFTIQLDSNNPTLLSELEIECRPDWAPLAAARFKELVELGFYKDSPFFRVLPGFIAQFGISADPTLNKEWMYCDTSDKEAVKLCKQPLPDEPRKVPNKKGTLSFASSGKNSRRTQVFINLIDNSGLPNFLDGQGFVPFARIVRGEDIIVKGLNDEYRGNVSQGKAAYYGKEYFEKVFPRLSVIRDVL